VLDARRFLGRLSYDAAEMGTAQTERQAKAGRRRPWTGDQNVFMYRFACYVTGLLLRFWVRRYRVYGAENVPTTGGLYVIANHTSGLDPFLLAYPLCRHGIRGPGKIELFKNPVVGWVMKRLGIFPLRQGTTDPVGVRTMVSLYRAGQIVIVYPEGGRSPDGSLRPFRPEFARLVIKMRARVLPAAIAGAPDVLPIGSLMPRSNTPVAVVYGEPFELSEYYAVNLTDEVAMQAAADLQSRVAELLERARRERDAASR